MNEERPTKPQRWGTPKMIIIILILAMAFIIDLIIFYKMTNRPLGFKPFDPKASPQLATRGEASVIANESLLETEAGMITPSILWEGAISEGSQKYEVRGFGFKNGQLYLQVRMYESMDFSLSKGWGKAFLLIDSEGKEYIFDSRKFPNAVEVHDMFVDLPNDLQARQTVVPGGYRDLVLVFTGCVESQIPTSLKVVEAFQGNSPANPGIVYDEVTITRTGQKQATGPVMAMPPGNKDCQSKGAVPLPGQAGTDIQVQGVTVDQTFRPEFFLQIRAQEDSILVLTEAILAGPDGASYNMLELEKEAEIKVAAGEGKTMKLVFEKLPATLSLNDCRLHLNFITATGETHSITLDL